MSLKFLLNEYKVCGMQYLVKQTSTITEVKLYETPQEGKKIKNFIIAKVLSFTIHFGKSVVKS